MLQFKKLTENRKKYWIIGFKEVNFLQDYDQWEGVVIN